MEPDATDVFGRPIIPDDRPAQPSGWSLTFGQVFWYSIALCGLYVFGQRLRMRVLLWRERQLKLQTRRRYGIPDNDLRPFNVAYADAVRRAQEEEKHNPKPRRAPPAVVDLRETSQEQTIRNRSGIVERTDAGRRSTVVPFPGAYRSESANPYPPSYLRNDEENLAEATSYQELQTNGQFTHAPLPAKKLLRQRARINVMEQSGITDKKRSFEHDEDMDDEEHEAKAKKTRLQNEAEDQLMDDEDAPRHRGSKRGAVDEYEGEDEEGGPIASGSRGKRARKVSQADSSMDVDAYDEEADDVPDLRHIESVRGKKRDRAEAGSTFGGDDDDEEAGSAGEFENDKAHRRRKRRTVGRKSDVSSSARGKKRDRSDEFSGNEFSGESSPERRASASRNRKKGKRGSLLPEQAQALRRERRQGEEEGGSDISMDGSVSTSIRMTGRNVGDEWESNGIKYKVGPNFQRLRLALVKKATQKYPMPKDSQHPDRDANLQVCVEKWLTEEEYQDAKAKHMLAWQDETPSQTPAPPEKLTLDILSAQQDSVPFPSVNPTGKNLLWGSSTTTTPTMSPAPPSPPSTGGQPPAVNGGYATPIHGGRLGRHSIATAGLPVSPFNVSQVPTAKRIASTSRALNLAASVSGSPGDLITNEEVPPSPGLYDSTNASGPGTPRSLKVWSKWEKQEHEARAMMKIREANRKKEAEKEAKLKEERERQERAERERQEKARWEREAREKAEKERQERERQERERKEKEAEQQKAAAAAAAAATPQIAPSTSAAPASTASPFSFSVPGTAAAPSPFGAPKTETKPSAPVAASGFSFGPSTSGAASGAPQTKGFSFGGAPPLGSTTSTEAKKDEGAGGGGPSLLSRLGQPAPAAVSNEPPKPATGASVFGFGAPKDGAAAAPANPFAAPTSTTTTPAASGATSTPKFDFGFGAKTGTTTGAGSGGAKPTPSPFGAPPSASSLSGALGPDANKAGASGAASPFGAFKTPGAPASATNGAAGTTTAVASGGAAPIKFNFTAPSAFSGASGPGAGATGGDAAKSAFGGAASSGQSAFGGAAGASGQSAFGNAASGGQSAFGNVGSTGKSAFGNTGSTGQSAFGGNAGTSGQSMFGGGASTSTPSPFGAGASQTQNPFGATTSNGSSKPADSKNVFNFSGQPSTASAAATTTPASNTGSAPLKFSFGTAPASTPAASSGTPAATATPASGSPAPFTFNFGATSTPAATGTTPAASPFGAPAASSPQSVFGATSKPSVFGSTAFGSTANQQK